MLMVFPLVVWGQDTPTFGGGDGTQNNPYQISTPDHLKALADAVNEKGILYEGSYFELITDINLNGNENNQWSPIGDYSYTKESVTAGYYNVFKGTFDGNNCTISGIYIKAGNRYQGLFGYIGKGGTVKNLHIEGYIGAMYEEYGVYVGGICGENEGTIESCSSSVDIELLDDKSGQIGGICGYNYGGIIRECVNKGEVKADRDNFDYIIGIGGICGNNRTVDDAIGTIIGCSNTGSVYLNALTGYLGGICGNNNNGGEISECFNIGKVNKEGGEGSVGGIVGYNHMSSLKTSYNVGNVSVIVKEDWAECGGVAGSNIDGTIQSCYNVGALTLLGDAYDNSNFGGVCGVLDGTSTLEACYNAGTMNAEAPACLGGVVGTVWTASSISGNFNVGNLTSSGTNNFGTICGWEDGSSSASYSENGYLSGSGIKGYGDGTDKEGMTEMSPDELVTAMNNQLTSGKGWATTASYSGSTLTLPKLSDDAEEEAPTVLVWEDIEAEISPESTDGWYGSEVTLTAPEGFEISLEENDTYAESVTYSEEGEHELTYYLKAESGAGTHEYTASIKIDLTAPIVEVNTNQDSYTLTLSDGEGSGIASLKIDGVEVDLSELEEGVYSAVGSEGKHTYEVTDKVGHTTRGEFSLESSEEPDAPQITYYDVRFVENDSVNFDYKSDQVREGNTFSFSASVAEGYDPKTLVVEYRRGPVGIWREATLDSDGKYHIRANYADLYIRARVEPLVPTGIEQVGDEAVEVYTAGDAIHVYTPTKERIIIVSISGAVVRMEEQVGKRSYTGLSDGVYIVRVGERSYKVRL